MVNRRINRKTGGIILLSLALSLGLCACETVDTQSEETVITEGSWQEEAESVTEEPKTTGEPSTEQEQQEAEETASEQPETLQPAGVTLEDIPAYDGVPYITVNDNSPYFTDEEKTSVEPFEYYSDLDELGRCGTAYANVCLELMPTEERGEIGSIRPSGWHTVKYNGVVDGNYLYNRCHLIGYQLAGENDNEKNLLTGTRYLNVEGMLPFENMVDAYVEETEHHVLYRVTPMFQGDNLLADGVLMEAWSVEDGGQGICYCVYCYNIQPGIGLDYATGDSWLEEETVVQEDPGNPDAEQQTQETVTDANAVQTQEVANDVVIAADTTYVLNTNTHKFHKPDCSSVKDMKAKNLEQFTGTRDEAVSMGYDPCGRCNP